MMRLISSTRANNWVTVHVEVEEAVIKNKYKRKRSETKCRNVCQQSCKRRRRVVERAEGGREGVRGKSAAMCWGVHLYPEQVFSAPLAGPLIRNRHACLVPSKASLSPISAAQALGKMMLN